MEQMYYIGLDVHKKKISCCVKDVSGPLGGAFAGIKASSCSADFLPSKRRLKVIRRLIAWLSRLLRDMLAWAATLVRLSGEFTIKISCSRRRHGAPIALYAGDLQWRC
jgi:hypothetical protein